jgi:hypothetical protein
MEPTEKAETLKTETMKSESGEPQNFETPKARWSSIFWYLNSHPDHWTQGEDFEDLKAHLRDLYEIYRVGGRLWLRMISDWQPGLPCARFGPGSGQYGGSNSQYGQSKNAG